MQPSTTTQIVPLMKKVLIWEVTPSLADAVFAWGNVALLVGAVLVALGTIVTIKMGSVREYFADLRISNNEADTASAKSIAAQATESAEQARKETEVIRSANLALQGQVEQERAARLLLEQRLSPRHLSADVSQALSIGLRQFSQTKMKISVLAGDSEAKEYAADFVKALRSAGWNVGPNDGINQAFWSGPVPKGINIHVSKMDVDNNAVPPAANMLILLLNSLGLKTNNIRDASEASGDFSLFVGAKPGD